jgi:NAD(P)H-hydrate repair Nnr-like enzyme with NAD(P)H-hydrate dehydratase domain
VEYNETVDVESQSTAVLNLSQKLNNVTILKKGKQDIISDGLQGSFYTLISSLL